MGARLDYGDWNYKAGVSGTPDLPNGSRVTLITCVGGAGGGTCVISGHDTIPIPDGIPFSIEPRGQLEDPTIVFTNTVTYTVEYMQ